MRIEKKKYNRKRKLKLIKKTVFSGVAVVALVTTIVASGKNIIEKRQDEYNKKTNWYIENENNDSDLPFYDELENYSKESEKALEYINVSEKLNKLDLDEYDVSYFNYELELYEPDDILLLIEKYEDLKKEVDDTIGNDVIELNEVVYVLTQQEKLTNQKLYESYDVLGKYSLALAKALLADRHAIEDPSTIKISYHYEKEDLAFNGSFTADNFTYNLYSNNEVSDKILSLADCSNDMSNQNETDITKIQSYNSDRNEKIEDTYNYINKLTSQIIEITQEENEKGNQK